MSDNLNPIGEKKFFLSGITVNLPHGPPPGFWYGLLPVLLIIGTLSVSEELRFGFFEMIFGKKTPITDVRPVPPAPPHVQVKPAPPVSEPSRTKETTLAPVPKVPGETSTKPDIQVLPAQYEVWMDLKYGGLYSGPASMTRALEKAHIRLPNDIEEVFRRHMSQSIPRTASATIVRVTVAELGFSKAATLRDIVESAKKIGLRPFPFDAIPAMALAFSGDNKLFFATQIAPEAYPWRAVLSLARSSARKPPYFELVEWHDIVTRTFSREETFSTHVVFLFSA